MAYDMLRQSLKIKNTIFPNRIVFPPVQTDYATPEGRATERLIRFHENIARNNVGLSIVGATGISPKSRLGPQSLCLYDDSHVDSARKLFAAIRKAGSVPAVQLNHGGRIMSPDLAQGDVVGPSAIPSPMGEATPRELTGDEVEEIIGQFVHAAEAAKNAGASLVEFHGAHSYLLNQFLSPASNHRTDKYGGSTENRGRIVQEILRMARKRLGEDFILGLRMSVEEYVEGGLTLEESIDLITMFVESDLDVIHVSAGGMDAGPRMIQEAAAGEILRLAGEVKKKVSIPVIGVGGIIKLAQAEEALREGMADMVAIGRGLIADPEFVTKSLAGRGNDVNECTGCLQCFMPAETPGMTCSVNDNI
jgi:2,4-dienoyl-CoA reductase-like NADH-dependent reductase (Old Yellow Enzyme family)